MTDYHYPAITVDIAVLNWKDEDLKLLLIERKNPPFQGSWALPGGFMEEEEPFVVAAYRELQEETGLAGEFHLQEVGTFGKPGRDPRGRTVSIVFRALLIDFQGSVSGQDDARDAAWFSVRNLPALAFDHETIVQAVLDGLKHHVFCPYQLADVFVPPEIKAFFSTRGEYSSQ